MCPGVKCCLSVYTGATFISLGEPPPIEKDKKVSLENLTPAEKAKRTRLHKKAYAIMAAAVEPQYTKWEEALIRNIPIRDRYIANLEAERDAAIAEINRKYEEQYAIQIAQFEHMMKPTQDAYEKAREEAWVVYHETMKAGA